MCGRCLYCGGRMCANREDRYAEYCIPHLSSRVTLYCTRCTNKLYLQWLAAHGIAYNSEHEYNYPCFAIRKEKLK